MITAAEMNELNKKSVTVRVSSVFPAEPDAVWEKLPSVDTLRSIASPYASFTAVDGQNAPVWREGETFRFKFRLFCVMPLGIHTVRILKFDKASLSVYSRESNPFVPVWNHAIRLEPAENGKTRYTDEVELYAGRKTPFVRLWAEAFYRHRQKKWLRLL